MTGKPPLQLGVGQQTVAGEGEGNRARFAADPQLGRPALAGGVAMYFALQRHFKLHLHHPKGWTGRLIFTHAIDVLFALAGRFTQRLENGSLQRYAAWMIGFAVLLASWPWLTVSGGAPGTGSVMPTVK